ncbi:unnamed protein product, partial [Meganyctiphanes norvegica]
MSPVRGRPKIVVLLGVATVAILLLCHQARKIINSYGKKFNTWSLIFSLEQLELLKVDKYHNEVTRIRILCLIVTSPQHHGNRAVHVAATWARHCDRAVFLTTELDPRLPNVLLTPGAADYNSLWDKVTKEARWVPYTTEVWPHWMKVGGEVKFDAQTNPIIGFNSVLGTDAMKLLDWGEGSVYLNGGAGYALSQGAVAALVENGLQNNECKSLPLGTAEDVNMAMCLRHLGTEFVDSRDKLGRQRFHVYPPNDIIDPRAATTWKHLWLKKIPTHPYRFGFSELSDEVISFHYVNPETMYLIYYLVYHLHSGTMKLQQPQAPFNPNPK